MTLWQNQSLLSFFHHGAVKFLNKILQFRGFFGKMSPDSVGLGHLGYRLYCHSQPTFNFPTTLSTIAQSLVANANPLQPVTTAHDGEPMMRMPRRLKRRAAQKR